MKEIISQVVSKITRRRSLGEDTRRLPSLVKAMRALVPRAVMKEVVASSHDRRQWGVLAAAWVGVSEREFISAAARELSMPYQDHVAVPDMTIFGSKARPMMQSLRKIGAVPLLQGDRIVGFVATDPAEVRGVEFFDGTQMISMAPWTEISKALDVAERMIAESEANVDRSEALRRKELCDKVISILINEAMQHGATSLEILSSEGKSRYQFTTIEGKVAVGSIQPQALESVLVYLHSIDGDVFSHNSVGKVLVRALGSSANVRLSWSSQDTPIGISWTGSERVSVAPQVPVLDEKPVPASGGVEAEREELVPVLVVDDNPMFCRILERLLKRERFEVSFAENGRVALDNLLGLVSFMPRVIICDLHMPEMNGKEFVQRLKENPRLRSIPVIMLTSDDGVDAEVAALEVGADALISKTKDPRVLCAQVLRLSKLGVSQEAAAA
ncbi:MAG: PleD family two-component system response regulator [Pseudomonadota bacterium]|jgi:CheY-like chemotaxis protein